MIRCATLAALCAFGLSNIAHASYAVTQAVPVELLGSGTLQFNPSPLGSGSIAEAVATGEQAYNTVGGLTGGSGSGQAASTGGSVSITDLTVGTISGSLYGQIVGGGNTTVVPGPIIITSPLITSGEGWGSGSTLIVSPPFFPTPAPTYAQHAGMTCSGAFSVAFGAQTTVNCQADLWFTNGFVDANQSIVANASGNILIDNVSFVAPRIEFNAGGNFITSLQPLWLTGHTIINALGVGLNGPIQVSGTGSLNINTPTIPEPSTWALMGLGLVGMGLATRRKA